MKTCNFSGALTSQNHKMLRLAGPLAPPGPTRTSGDTQKRLARTTTRQLLKISKEEIHDLCGQCVLMLLLNQHRRVSRCSDRGFSLCLLPFILALGTTEKKAWLHPPCLSPLQFSTVWFYLIYDRQKFSKEFASDFKNKNKANKTKQKIHRSPAWWKVNCYIIKSLAGLNK